MANQEREEAPDAWDYSLIMCVREHNITKLREMLKDPWVLQTVNETDEIVRSIVISLFF